MRNLIRDLITSRLSYVAGAMVLTMAMQSHVVVAGSVNGSYTIDIASSERLLDALGTPNEAAVQQQESCDNPHYRVRARNKPAVMITNDAGSAGDITSITLQLNESVYLFGQGDTALDGFDQYIKNSAYTDAGVDITSSSVSGSTLTVNFSGLSASKSVIFRIDIDTNDPNIFPFPDFRTVLFGADTGNGPGTPAEHTATFTSGDMSSTTLATQLDSIVGQMEFFEGQVRPYHSADPVIPHGGGGTVPEPTSAVLFLAGMMSAIALRRKQR